MVLPEARHQLAQHVRHLAAGLITNDQFDYATIEYLAGRATQDRGLNQVYSEAWCLYHDLWSYKLCGRNSLSKPLRHDVARWIMFLYSDLEYEWPVDFGDAPSGLTNLITLGGAGRRWRHHLEGQMRALGAWDLWPFFSRSDFEQCRKHPRLLRGAP